MQGSKSLQYVTTLVGNTGNDPHLTESMIAILELELGEKGSMTT
jgi:hypothetical protein